MDSGLIFAQHSEQMFKICLRKMLLPNMNARENYMIIGGPGFLGDA
jgi:hypothetical protein